jgi:hypothetical protein
LDLHKTIRNHFSVFGALGVVLENSEVLFLDSNFSKLNTIHLKRGTIADVQFTSPSFLSLIVDGAPSYVSLQRSILANDTRVLLHEGPQTDATIFRISITVATAAVGTSSGSIILYKMPIGETSPTVIQFPSSTPTPIVDLRWAVGGETLFAILESGFINVYYFSPFQAFSCPCTTLRCPTKVEFCPYLNCLVLQMAREVCMVEIARAAGAFAIASSAVFSVPDFKKIVAAPPFLFPIRLFSYCTRSYHILVASRRTLFLHSSKNQCIKEFSKAIANIHFFDTRPVVFFADVFFVLNDKLELLKEIYFEHPPLIVHASRSLMVTACNSHYTVFDLDLESRAVDLQINLRNVFAIKNQIVLHRADNLILLENNEIPVCSDVINVLSLFESDFLLFVHNDGTHIYLLGRTVSFPSKAHFLRQDSFYTMNSIFSIGYPRVFMTSLVKPILEIASAFPKLSQHYIQMFRTSIFFEQALSDIYRERRLLFEGVSPISTITIIENAFNTDNTLPIPADVIINQFKLLDDTEKGKLIKRSRFEFLTLFLEEINGISPSIIEDILAFSKQSNEYICGFLISVAASVDFISRLECSDLSEFFHHLKTHFQLFHVDVATANFFGNSLLAAGKVKEAACCFAAIKDTQKIDSIFAVFEILREDRQIILDLLSDK